MKVKSLFSLLVILLGFFIAGAGSEKGNDDYTQLTVKNDSVLNQNFLGVNAVYHGFTFMEETGVKVMTEADRKQEFDRVKNMGLNIARTWYRPDWSCGNSLYNDFKWESKRMKEFYLWLDKMKALKVDVALQAGWWFTKDTYHNTNGTALPDPEKDPVRYAEWVKESLYQLVKVRGYTNIKYLILFTEPLNYRSGIIPDGYTEPQYYDKVCTRIHEELKKANLRSLVSLVGPNSGSTDTAAFVGWAAGCMNDVIDIYSWHSYNGKQSGTNPPLEYHGWKKIADVGEVKIRSTGKPFWIDEYGASKPDESVRSKPDYGNYLAQCVAAFINSGAQTSLIWILFDQKYPGSKTTNKDSFYNGVHRWGLTRSPQDSIESAGDPYPAWYAFSMMSKYLGGRNGTKTLKTVQADSLFVSATQTGKDISVMVVNAGHSSAKFRLNFAKPVRKKLNRILYDPVKISMQKKDVMLTSDRQFQASANGLPDKIPSRSVAIYSTLK